MNVATLALAKSYTDSQRVAYTETCTITYDGNGEKIDLLGDGITFAKVSDSPVDFTNTKRVDIHYRSSGLTLAVPFAVGSEDGLGIVSNESGTQALAFSVPQGNEVGIAPGVYVFDGSYQLGDNESEVIYISCIATETIHPIEPKFLPGVCLPVVELGSIIENGFFALSDGEAKQVEAAVGVSDYFLVHLLKSYETFIVRRAESEGPTYMGYCSTIADGTGGVIALAYDEEIGWGCWCCGGGDDL